MTYSAKWLRLCETEKAYRIRQNKLLLDQAQMARDLKQALAGAEGNLTAIGILEARCGNNNPLATGGAGLSQ